MSPDPRSSDIEQKVASAPAIVSRHFGGAAEDGALGLAANTDGQCKGNDPQPIIVGGSKATQEANADRLGIDDSWDADLARSVVSALAQTLCLGEGKVGPVVRNGWLILEGEVAGRTEKRAAEDAVKGLSGIRGVSNNILIESEAISRRVCQKIEEAFVRNALLSAKRISVTASNHRIILSGCVASAAERDAAEMAAWAVRGVAHVVNRLHSRT